GANAHGLEADRLVGGLEVVDQRAHDAGARHAERVAEVDGPTVGVELALDVDAELVADGQDLGGEGLVELDDVDVGDVHAGRRQHLAHGLDGAHAHDLGRQTRHRAGDDAGKGGQPQR